MTGLSTLCYIEKDHKYLMLHRVVKKNDVNKDKWIGVGGHFEEDESPEECLLREVWEETGYRLTDYRFRGIVTFVSGDGVTEYMHLFTATGFEGTPVPCNEGVLEWVDKDDVWNLNLWEGDKIFFRLLDERDSFFSLKLVYDGCGCLVSADLDGQPMELFDILHEDGTKTGVVKERGVAHREGALHGTVHIWIVRPKESGFDVLLQKRSEMKDSNPGDYYISSAGHMAAGDDPLQASVREMKEELGLDVRPEQLHYVGKHRGAFEAVFHGKMFRDNEISSVYVYTDPVEIEQLTLQEEELEEVRWMDYEECHRRILDGSLPNCIYEDEFRMVGEYLKETDMK